jgi:prepilin-type N-terminal cleavage/methylation domain-containing protein
MNMTLLKNTKAGFTLIEVTVVVAIIGILASVIAVNAVDSGRQSRDAERQANLKTLQAAVELYKSKYGKYPAGCNGVNQWSGQIGTTYSCPSGSTQYIVGLAPEFIPTLPADKKLNGANSGYVYVSNRDLSNPNALGDGTVYKIMAMNTVEVPLPSSVSAYLHPLRSCLMNARVNNDNSVSDLSGASSSWCNITGRALDGIPPGNNIPHCRFDNPRFQRSFGVWGGFAPCTGSCIATTNSVEAWTEQIICK